jgi:hypothetical protein
MTFKSLENELSLENDDLVQPHSLDWMQEKSSMRITK